MGQSSWSQEGKFTRGKYYRLCMQVTTIEICQRLRNAMHLVVLDWPCQLPGDIKVPLAKKQI